MNRMRMNPYLLFSVFYFVQGAVQSYLSNFQKPYLLKAGVSLDKIAMLSAVMVGPFWLKSLYGIVSDRIPLFGDHRKSYMVLGLAMAAIGYFALAFVNPGQQFETFFLILLGTSVGMAIFDTCADGFAVDITPANREGVVQSSMMLGRGVGYILLALVFGRLAFHFGIHSVFLALSGLILFVSLVVVTTTPRIARSIEKIDLLQWVKWRPTLLRDGDFLWLASYSILYSIASFGIDGLTTLFGQVKLGFNDEILGNMGSFQGIGSILGALLGAVSIGFLGVRRSAFLGVIMISLGGFLVTKMSDPPSAYAISLVWGVLWAFQETLILVLCMMASRGTLAATLFATLMVSSNVGSSVGEWTGTTLFGHVGPESTFLILASGNLLLLPFLWLYFRRLRVTA